MVVGSHHSQMPLFRNAGGGARERETRAAPGIRNVEGANMETREDSAGYPVSQLALALPAMPDHDYGALRDDIQENGQREPIAVLNGEIVDGRHRLRACCELGLEPKYVFLPADTDALKYILSKNRFRRNLNASQSAIAAARVYRLSLEGSQRDGGDDGGTGSESANLQIGPLTQAEAAALFGVRQRTFSYAIALLGNTPTESLTMAVEQGHIAVSDAVRVVNEPKDVQEAAVEKVLGGAATTVSSAVSRGHREQNKGVETESPNLESWRSPAGTATLHNCAISSLRALVDRESVDTIVGHVPVGEGAVETLRELRDFTAHALKDDGTMVLLCRAMNLPEALEHLRHRGIEFLCEFDYRIDHPARALGGRHGIDLRRMPLLVYGKSQSVLTEGDDVIQLPPVADGSDAIRIGVRHAVGAELVIRRFAVPSGLVCDPLLMGGANTALAAIRYGCGFVGSSPEQKRFEFVRDRMAREYVQ